MNRKLNLLLLVMSCLLALILVATGCTPAATSKPSAVTSKSPASTTTPAAPTSTPKAAAPTEKTYRAVNPLGTMPPVETKALSPRLDKLDGKTIWVIQAESDPVIMPAIWDRVQKDYPNTTWKKSATNATSYTAEQKLTAEQLKAANAAICGVAF
jgi:hypothetical protein